MKRMTQEDAFSLNAYVESFLDEEPSCVKENYLHNDILKKLITNAKKFLDLPNDANKGKWFWYRKGGIEKQQWLQEFSNEYIKPLLRDDALLIGDTAFYINYPPHDVHVDNRDYRGDPEKDGIIGYKSVVIPLEIDTTDCPYLFTADQYFYGPSTRMRNGCEELDKDNPEHQRQQENGVYFSYDYAADGVKYLASTKISKSYYQEYIDEPYFVPYSTFDKLSIEGAHRWKPGNLIIFDSSRIHWAEKLTKRGATYKFGISLNYGLKIK
jgi:hypothetical protein